MSPRRDVSEERRQEIITAATRVFAKRGFGDARMDDIVKESGLSKGLLYWYFKNKDAVIEAVLRKLFSPMVKKVVALPSQPGSAEDRLRSLGVESVAEFYEMGKSLPITIELYALALRNKLFRKIFAGFLTEYVDAISEIIEQGVSAGEFGPTDSRTAAVSMGAIIEGTLLLWLFDSKTVQLEEQIRSAMDLMINGLKKK